MALGGGGGVVMIFFFFFFLLGGGGEGGGGGGGGVGGNKGRGPQEGDVGFSQALKITDENTLSYYEVEFLLGTLVGRYPCSVVTLHISRTNNLRLHYKTQ